MPSTSLSGYVYYVTLINYYTCKNWVYFMKPKDEVFQNFNEFKALEENLSKRKIKTLESYNEVEYNSNEF